MDTVPSLEWYTAASANEKRSPRCPIATADLCPRYYASRWLLGNAGLTTEISPEDVARLDRKWQPFKPVTKEEEAGLIRTDGQLSSVSEFCPEVSFETFGYFATFLGTYADDIDRGVAHDRLRRAGVPRSNPYWQWASVVARHYTACREFSVFCDLTATGPKRGSPKKRAGLPPKTRWQVLARDDFTCQYCGRRPPEVVLEVDHRLSVRDGGSDEQSNLLAACTDCNRGKGSDSLS